MFGYFYYDWTILLILPALIISVWAQIKVSSTFNKYSKVLNRRGMTGADAARAVLDANGVRNVRIERIRGHLSDHFDPTANVIRLSEDVYDSRSTAAVGVAAHEAGHAAQYAQGYSPIKLRAAIIPITRFGSMLAMPLFFIGIIVSIPALMYGGIILYSAVAVFQLVTLPVEFDASARAVKVLEQKRVLAPDELKGAKSVLTAAALTYVAALLTSLLTLLRLLLLANGRSNRR